jgi:pimeloyl-ACP methyl ester carboxylesterase
MEKLILLHGALGAEKQFDQLKQSLSSIFDIYTFNFIGHGGRELDVDSFTIEGFSEELLGLIQRVGEPVNIFGYSMGGYVALYAALQNHGKIKKIFTLATKFEWSQESAEREVKMLNPKVIEERLPAFAEELKERHFPVDWKLNMEMTAKMMLSLGKNPLLNEENLGRIEQEVLFGIGDKDKMVSLEETARFQRYITKSNLLVIPGTPHPLEKVNNDRLCYEIHNFFLK